MAGIGRPPKPPSKRRRTNKPASYGDAEAITAPAAGVQDRELGRGSAPASRVDVGGGAVVGRGAVLLGR